MPKVLTQEQVDAYHRDGFLFPVRVMDRESAHALRRKLEDVEQTIGGELQERYRIKAHLPFPWLNELIRNPVMLDAVEGTSSAPTSCVGAPASSPRTPTTPGSSPGTRTQPTTGWSPGKP